MPVRENASLSKTGWSQARHFFFLSFNKVNIKKGVQNEEISNIDVHIAVLIAVLAQLYYIPKSFVISTTVGNEIVSVLTGSPWHETVSFDFIIETCPKVCEKSKCTMFVLLAHIDIL